MSKKVPKWNKTLNKALDLLIHWLRSHQFHRSWQTCQLSNLRWGCHGGHFQSTGAGASSGLITMLKFKVDTTKANGECLSQLVVRVGGRAGDPYWFFWQTNFSCIWPLAGVTFSPCTITTLSQQSTTADIHLSQSQWGAQSAWTTPTLPLPSPLYAFMRDSAS